MALFQINRYCGDEIVDDESKSREARKLDILNRLNRKAKSHKDVELNESSTSINDTSSPSNDHDKTRKKKKRKHNECNDEDELPQIPSKTALTNEKHKKKKRETGKDDKTSQTSPDEVTLDVNEKPSKLSLSGKEKDSSTKVDKSKTISETVDSDVSSLNILDKTATLEEGDGEVESGSAIQSHGDVGNEIGGFTILGKSRSERTQKVVSVHPDWLAHPSIVSDDIRSGKTPLDDVEELEEDMKQKLRENGIHSLFPVQAQVIPYIMESLATGLSIGRAGYRPSDLCVSAPTGSGKTLTFVLPIVQALKKRIVCHMRALVVLPVLDLASQVYRVFKTYCEGTKLKVGLVIGQKTFANEQSSLIMKGVRGYHSLVDILVATPGRLVDHINRTPGFKLNKIRFLVIDEADTVMDEIKQDWLSQVQKAVCQYGRPNPGVITVKSEGRLLMPLQKMLFSATLSQNPEKLQQLGLFQPKLFTSVVKDTKHHLHGKDDKSEVPPPGSDSKNKKSDDNKTKVEEGEFVGKFSTPSGLTEMMMEISAAEKPLVMLHLLLHLKFRHILCFTNTAEAAHRLYWLVKLIGGVEVREFSANLHALKRTRLIKQFAAGKIDLLICTDSMARGMDLENVKYIISYERPLNIRTYIHRVGRTARAGKVGIAITMLERKEIFHFKKMMKEAGKDGVKEMKVSKSDLKPLVEPYQDALKPLPGILKNEKFKNKKR